MLLLGADAQSAISYNKRAAGKKPQPGSTSDPSDCPCHDNPLPLEAAVLRPLETDQ
jgi:hypothetical protein